jgi:hypothetical protein
MVTSKVDGTERIDLEYFKEVSKDGKEKKLK